VVNIGSDKGVVEVKVKKEESIEFMCLATGVGSNAFNYKYQWFLNNNPVPGQHTSKLVIKSVSEDDTGDYTCSVQNLFNGIGQSHKITLTLGK